MARIALRAVALGALTSFAVGGICAAQAAPLEERLALASCTIPGPGGGHAARCGTLTVFEDRDAGKGRTIGIRLVVLPALADGPLPDPVFFFAGGPGQGAAQMAGGQAGSGLRKERDLVFVDQRGTGESNRLDCDLYRPGIQGYLMGLLPAEGIADCARQLGARADLRLYTTPIAMADVDEVRAALGYDRINLHGGSYGTRAALVYLRQYPERVRSVVLAGVSPVNHGLPLSFARDAQHALDGVFDDCEADSACRAAFPNVRMGFAAVLARLRQQPVEVEIQPTRDAEPVRVSFGHVAFVEAVREMLYSVPQAASLPLHIHRAAAGDFAPLAEFAVRYRQRMHQGIALGMFLSLTCAEDIPFIDRGQIAAETRGFFLGDVRLRAHMAACESWPRGRLPAGYHDPVRSSVPVLILSGQFDPVTPPRWGVEVAKHLPNSRHVVVPRGAHSFGGLPGAECVPRMIEQFIREGSGSNLDASCVTGARRPPFALQQPER